MNKSIFFVKMMIVVFFISLSFQVKSQIEGKNDYPLIGETRLSLGYYYPSLSVSYNKTDVAISLNYWIQELTKNVGIRNVKSILYTDISLMNDAFKAGELDMIIAPPLLIATVFDRELLSDGFVGVNSIHNLDNLVIIVRKEENKPFTGYKNKRLVLPKNDLLAKVFLEKIVFKQFQLSLNNVFSDITIKTKDQRMVLDLFFNKADIAIVYESSLKVILELNPQLNKKIKVLHKFPLLGRNFSYFHHDFRYKQKLQEGIYMFNKEARGKQILQIFHTTFMKICKVSYLDRFDFLYNEYLSLVK